MMQHSNFSLHILVYSGKAVSKKEAKPPTTGDGWRDDECPALAPSKPLDPAKNWIRGLLFWDGYYYYWFFPGTLTSDLSSQSLVSPLASYN